MYRASHGELVERWSLTYREDGYAVRAEDVNGLEPPDAVDEAVPDIEARKDEQRVLVRVIDSVESLQSPHWWHDLQTLSAARNDQTMLHLVVAVECMPELKRQMDGTSIKADLMHVT